MKNFNSASDYDAPRWADHVLRLLVGSRKWESISGDLLEEYRQAILPSAGPTGGRLWYARQLLSYATPLHFGMLGGILAASAIVLSNIVLPSLGIEIGPAPRAETVLNALCFGGLLLFWAMAGFLAHWRLRTLGSSLRWGATIAFIHIALIMLTFFAINNIFLDIVSRQPDKLWDFQHSGASSMRAYVNIAALKGLCFVLPVFVAVGAACGTAGGIVSSLFQRRHASR